MQLINGDCLEEMKNIPDGSIDMVLADPPYGTTKCKWDSVLDLPLMWEQLKRVIKPNGAIIMTASQPFTTALIASNIKMFKYCWYWNKNRPTGFANAKRQPLRKVEEVVVFYTSPPTYSPQGLVRINKTCKNSNTCGGDTVRGNTEESKGNGSLRTGGKEYVQEFTGYPNQVLDIKGNSDRKIHPTQKPVELMEYMVKTYTNEGDKVLDFCAGSFTTGEACINLNREFIGIEKDKTYFDIGTERLNRVLNERK